MPRTGLVIGLLLSLLLAGCASTARFPDNPPLTRPQPQVLPAKPDSGENSILMVLTFSGGGSRASALAYGVLEELANTLSPSSGKPLHQEIDMISAVSGGSITAAYFGLFGDRLFRDFRSSFLEQNITAGLKQTMLTPTTLSRLSSETFGTGDVLDEYFQETLFGPAPLKQLLDADGPFVEINATDLFKGGRFGFNTEQFNLICSDTGGFPISRAVAASSAVPIIFSPVTLSNHAGSCQYQPPAWIGKGLSEKGTNNRRYRLARLLNTYQDQTNHPYIHLLDGGLADNLGLRAVVDRIVAEGGLWNTLKRFDQQQARQIALVVVDASASTPSQWEQSPATPPDTAILDAATTTPLANYNFETLEYLRSNSARWLKEVQQQRCGEERGCQAPSLYLIELRLEDIPDPGLRQELTSVPTGFELTPEIAGQLISAGRQLLRDHPEFQRMLQSERGIQAPARR